MWHPTPLQINKLSMNERSTRVLYVLSNWAPKASLTLAAKKGRWIVRSRKDLAKECALTTRTLDRAIRDLKDAGLVVFERATFAGCHVHVWMQFPSAQEWKRASEAVQHGRRIGRKVAKPKAPKWQNPPPQSGKTVEGQVAKPLNLYITHEQSLKSEDQKESGCAAGFSGAGEEIEKIPGEEIMKLSDIAAELEAKQAEDSSDAAVEQALAKAIDTMRVGDLEKLWKISWVNAGFGYCPGLSKKDQGNLKHLAAEMGAAAPMLIVACLRGWSKFAPEAKKQAGFGGDAPQQPAVWFLHTHRGLALAWATKAVKSSEKPTSGASAMLPEDEELWGKL